MSLTSTLTGRVNILKAALVISSLVVLVACAPQTQSFVTRKPVREPYVLGLSPLDSYGLWTRYQVFGDGDRMAYDTTWSLIMKNPQFLAHDDRFLLVRNAKGKTIILTSTVDGKAVWKSTKSEEHYQRLRNELSVPQNLVLQAIEPPKREQ